MRSPTRRSVAAVFAVCVVAACSGSESDAPSTTQLVAIHAVSVDAVAVTGTAACDLSEDGVGADGEPGGLLAVCELDMSDPRVSGTERHDRFRDYGGEFPIVWVTEEAVITNAGGTWRGIAQAADDGTPCGEAHYVGEGAYEDLEFRYYFCHVDLGGKAELRGWISGGETAETGG